ncbi:MAG TPA: hypothetical protein VF631_08355 [Allosphingosinicella sp.]
MTNVKTAFVATLWMAVSGLMLLAALEPVSVQPQPLELAAHSAADNAA